MIILFLLLPFLITSTDAMLKISSLRLLAPSTIKYNNISVIKTIHLIPKRSKNSLITKIASFVAKKSTDTLVPKVNLQLPSLPSLFSQDYGIPYYKKQIVIKKNNNNILEQESHKAKTKALGISSALMGGALAFGCLACQNPIGQALTFSALAMTSVTSYKLIKESGKFSRNVTEKIKENNQEIESYQKIINDLVKEQEKGK
jgi:hypothetical protein